MQLSIAIVVASLAVPTLALVPPPAALMQRKLLRTELPEVDGQDWKTLDNGVEFLPAGDLSPLAEMHMRRLTGDTTYSNVYVDGTETYYDEYAQAWRALGFFIDCDYVSDTRRELQEGVDADMSCKRMMLWAAYVDEHYKGNEGGEYMYYDRKSNAWDDRACRGGSSTRCVKMDCHLSNTHFSLLGFFKEPSYGTWMDTLLMNQGDCVTTDDEYKVLQENRDVWPDQCTASGVSDKIGTAIYYDIKPSKYGELAIGLYNDTACIQEYKGSLSVLQVTKEIVCNADNNTHPCLTSHTNYHQAVSYALTHSSGNTTSIDTHGDIWELASSLEDWNAGFDVFKQCQPCKAYDLTTIVAGIDYAKGSGATRYNVTSAAMTSEAVEGDQQFFQCDDTNVNVNQCNKFKANTQMLTAKWTDIELAIEQGTIDDVPEVKKGFSLSNPFQRYGYAVAHQRQDITALIFGWLFLMASSVLFGAALFRYKAFKEEAVEISEPLMASEKAELA